jgi:hypothetical protein
MSIIYKPKGLLGGEFSSEYNVQAFPNQRADFWYCEGYGGNPVGVYTYMNYEVSIICNGEMRWNFDDGSRCWTAGSDIRVTTDEEAYAIMNAETTNVVNNCWLELFDENGGDWETMIIAENIDEAIQLAHDYIVDTYMVKEEG